MDRCRPVYAIWKTSSGSSPSSTLRAEKRRAYGRCDWISFPVAHSNVSRSVRSVFPFSAYRPSFDIKDVKPYRNSMVRLSASRACSASLLRLPSATRPFEFQDDKTSPARIKAFVAMSSGSEIFNDRTVRDPGSIDPLSTLPTICKTTRIAGSLARSPRFRSCFARSMGPTSRLSAALSKMKRCVPGRRVAHVRVASIVSARSSDVMSDLASHCSA